MKLKTKQAPLKILVCDDDPADRKLVRIHLRQVEDREIILLEAGQIDEIRDVLNRGGIDLILMDLQMPEKSGIEWLVEIVEREIAPVVMLTGAGSEEAAVQSLQEGAIGYIPKSVLSRDKLMGTINDSLEKWRKLQQSKATQEELERLANFDSLTGLPNRRAILNKLCEQIKLTQRYGNKLSLSLLDIDFFKKVNDQYGHLTGDDVLASVATLMKRDVRNVDIVGRYGGEEFIIVMPRTDASSAKIVAERIRETIKSAEMKDSEGNVFSITASQGLAEWVLGEDESTLISRADYALYKAKENGRDRAEVAP